MLPDARDDLGLVAVAGKALTIDVLANDYSPSGTNIASLRVTQQPCNLDTGGCVTGSAQFDATGKMIFTPASPGGWNFQYTFTDNTGVNADPGVVTVSAAVNEILAFNRARWTAPKKAGQLGTVDVTGTSNVTLSHRVELRLPNATTGANGCSNPSAGTQLAVTTVGANGAWAFAATALALRPATVYVYSPAFGGCSQASVQ